MSDTGVKYPGTISSTWTNASAMAADDDSYATSTSPSSQYYFFTVKLVLSGGEIGDSVSTGDYFPITTEAEQSYGGSSNLWGNTLSADNVNDSTFGVSVTLTNTPQTAFNTITCTNFNFGVPTGATINGVAFSCGCYYTSSRGVFTNRIDYIRLTVYYTEAAAGLAVPVALRQYRARVT